MKQRRLNEQSTVSWGILIIGSFVVLFSLLHAIRVTATHIDTLSASTERATNTYEDLFGEDLR